MRNSKKGRLKVWDRAQDSFIGDDLVFNFDTIDAIIGGPNGYAGSSGNSYTGSASTWLGNNDVIATSASTKYPGTTNGGYQNQVGKRSLYSVVSGLNYNDVPLGTIIQWWRPTRDIGIPDGWQPCDGSTIAQANHSFPLPGPITVPDLRNKMVIGADATVPGIKAFNGYALDANAQPALNQNNLWTSGAPKAAGQAFAPGIGYDSGLESPNSLTGSNVEKPINHYHDGGLLHIQNHYHDIQHTHTVKSHTHSIQSHTHVHSHVHLTPNHVHNFNQSSDITTRPAPWGQEYFTRVKPSSQAGDPFVANTTHVHGADLKGAGKTGDRDPIGWSSEHGLYPNGGASDPWPYAGNNPAGLTFPGSYTYSNVTSKPTLAQATSTTFVGHNLNETTDVGRITGTPYELIITGPSGDQSTNTLKDNSGRMSGQVNGDIIEQNGVKIADQMKVTGLTGNSGQAPINTRPQYVGLLYLIKVKVSTNVI